jgi:ribokinase
MKIAVIGSCNRDIVYGVDHIAIGGETVTAKSLTKNWGGKGLNQAVAAARSFDGVYMAGMINPEDADLCDTMRENNLSSELLAYSDKPTGHAVIYVDRAGQNSITIFGGANQALTPAYVEETLDRFTAGDIVMIQNETNALQEIIEGAHRRGLRVAINPSPFSPALLELPLEYVDFFFINEIEGAQITGLENPTEILAEMCTRYPDATVLLTIGPDGALCGRDGKVYEQAAYPVPVVDTTAAGDAFTGYFISGVARGLPLEKSLLTAAVASSITVSKAGASASIPYLQDVLAFAQTRKLDIN